MSTREENVRDVATEMVQELLEINLGADDISEFFWERGIEDGDPELFGEISEEIKVLKLFLSDRLDLYYNS